MKSDMFIDPKSDYAFKRFFGTVSNKELTIGFLNSLLNKDIKDIIFHNVEMQGNNTDSRKAVFDLFCEGSDGELFIVEIQKKRQKAKIERKKRKSNSKNRTSVAGCKGISSKIQVFFYEILIHSDFNFSIRIVSFYV